MNYPKNKDELPVPKLDTNFEDGLRGDMIVFQGGDTISNTPFSIDLERPPERDLDFRTIRFRSGVGGVALTVTLAGKGSRLVVIHPGWLGDGEHPLSEYQVGELANRSPDTRFAYINAPGVRGSDRLPDSVMKEMQRSGSYVPYGEVLNAVLANLIKDSDTTDGAGWSLGARALLGMLGATNERLFGKLVAIDGPGSRDLGGLLGIKKEFVDNEGAKALGYNQANADPDTIRLKQAGGVLGAVKLFGGMALRGALYQEVIGLPNAMAMPGLQKDLIEATSRRRNGEEPEIVLGSPELSDLNDFNDVLAIMRAVSEQTNSRLTQAIIRRQSHGFVDAHTPYMTQFIADILNNRLSMPS